MFYDEHLESISAYNQGNSTLQGLLMLLSTPAFRSFLCTYFENKNTPSTEQKIQSLGVYSFTNILFKNNIHSTILTIQCHLLNKLTLCLLLSH